MIEASFVVVGLLALLGACVVVVGIVDAWTNVERRRNERRRREGKKP